MVTLRKMTGEEFLCFKAQSIADYANDLMTGEDFDEEDASANAKEVFEDTLPDGLDTEGQYLMTIEHAESGKAVGQIWFFYEDEEDGTRQVWLSDFAIHEEDRRKGHATAAMEEMERMAKAAGCARSALFVWDHNPEEYSLYEKCGYTVFEHEDGGSVMKKDL